MGGTSADHSCHPCPNMGTPCGMGRESSKMRLWMLAFAWLVLRHACTQAMSGGKAKSCKVRLQMRCNVSDDAPGMPSVMSRSHPAENLKKCHRNNMPAPCRRSKVDAEASHNGITCCKEDSQDHLPHGPLERCQPTRGGMEASEPRMGPESVERPLMPGGGERALPRAPGGRPNLGAQH